MVHFCRLKISIAGADAPADCAVIATTPDGSKRQKICASWENAITGAGQVFQSAKEFRDALHKYAIAHRFHYKFVKNDSSRVTAECTDGGCAWRIHASKSHSKEFMVKKIFGTHIVNQRPSKVIVWHLRNGLLVLLRKKYVIVQTTGQEILRMISNVNMDCASTTPKLGVVKQ